MNPRNQFIRGVAWIQVFLSLFLGGLFIAGWFNYDRNVEQFVDSMASTVQSSSRIVQAASSSLENRKALMAEVEKTLDRTRELLEESRRVVEVNSKAMPAYAEGLRSSANLLGSSSNLVKSVGESLKTLPVPTIQVSNGIPSVILSRPLDAKGQALVDAANEVSKVGKSVNQLADSLGKDVPVIAERFTTASNQLATALLETSKSLAKVRQEELPVVAQELKNAAQKLGRLSLDMTSISFGIRGLFVAGITLALWCLVHGIGSLLTARELYQLTSLALPEDPSSRPR